MKSPLYQNLPEGGRNVNRAFALFLNCMQHITFQVSEAGVHRPHVAGIHGRETEGAYSIVLAGGYEDDKVNELINIIYTE